MKNKIGNHKKPSKKTKKDELDFHIGQILHSELFNLEPEDFTLDGFVNAAGDESWNLDEFNEKGYIMLKHMLFRMIIPFKDWDNSGSPAPIQNDEFNKMLKVEYLKRLNKRSEA